MFDYQLFPKLIINLKCTSYEFPELSPLGVSFSFRTLVPNALLVYAASFGDQEELIAIQLVYGRPYFIFDPQGSENCFKIFLLKL